MIKYLDITQVGDMMTWDAPVEADAPTNFNHVITMKEAKSEIVGIVKMVNPHASLEERLWSGVIPVKPNECWEWKKSKKGHGYGQLRYDGKSVLVHRISWTVHFGPIPDGMLVCHKCDNPSCCNPAHLFLGTQLENVHDMMAKGRMRRGSYIRVPKTHCEHGHPFDSENTYAYKGKRQCKICMRRRTRESRGGVKNPRVFP